MIKGQLTPFELAIHAPDKFREIFDADADEYLRQLGFEPTAARNDVVRLVCKGRRSHLLKRHWFARQQRLLRVQTARRLASLESRLRLSRRRTRRLRRLLRELIGEVEGGTLRRAGIRKRFAAAIRRKRVDCGLVVASERDLAVRYSADLNADGAALLETGDL